MSEHCLHGGINARAHALSNEKTLYTQRRPSFEKEESHTLSKVLEDSLAVVDPFHAFA